MKESPTGKRLFASAAIAVALIFGLVAPADAGGRHHRNRDNDRDVAPLFWFGQPDNLVGMNARTILERDDDTVKLKVRSKKLVPKGAYTVWFVVFNKPENCLTSPCGEADAFDAVGPRPDFPAMPSVMWSGAGGVADRKGRLNVTGRAGEGGEGAGAPGEVLFGLGILDAEQAELHAVVRYHGPVIPEILEEQISTFNGGCVTEDHPGFECVDVQASIHVPPDAGHDDDDHDGADDHDDDDHGDDDHDDDDD